MERISTSSLKSWPVFRAHLWVFLGANILLFLIDWLLGDAWWFHFIFLVWAAVVMAHYMIVKTLNVDNDWADDRAEKLRLTSYDLGHILQISDSYNEKDVEKTQEDESGPAETR